MARGVNAIQAVINLELSCSRFYRNHSRRLYACEVKDFLKELAAIEEGHAAAFASLALDPFSSRDLNEAFEVAGPILRFTIESAEEMGREMDGVRSKLDLVEVALKLESNALALYGNLLNGLHEPGMRRMVRRLVREEKDHFDRMYVRRAEFMQEFEPASARRDEGLRKAL